MKTKFEYTLGKEHADNRVWIRVTSPDGETAADIGLLVNDEGISIDVWATDSDGGGHPDDGPIIAPWLLWSDIGEG